MLLMYKKSKQLLNFTNFDGKSKRDGCVKHFFYHYINKIRVYHVKTAHHYVTSIYIYIFYFFLQAPVRLIVNVWSFYRPLLPPTFHSSQSVQAWQIRYSPSNFPILTSSFKEKKTSGFDSTEDTLIYHIGLIDWRLL